MIHQRHRQTDRQTTCDSKTALCTVVHRVVKTASIDTKTARLDVSFSSRQVSRAFKVTRMPACLPIHVFTCIIHVFLPVYVEDEDNNDDEHQSADDARNEHRVTNCTDTTSQS